MTQAKWTRPEPGPTARIFREARLAIDDAQHAGDVRYAARVLSWTAWRLVAHDAVWTRVRPPLGRYARRHQDEAA